MPHVEDGTPLTPLVDNESPTPITVPDSHDNESPTPITVTDSHDSVFASDPSPDTSSSVSSPDTPMPIPRRSTRSTKGKPPERYGNVYTFDTLVDMGSYFQCPCDYCTGK